MILLQFDFIITPNPLDLVLKLRSTKLTFCFFSNLHLSFISSIRRNLHYTTYVHIKFRYPKLIATKPFSSVLFFHTKNYNFPFSCAHPTCRCSELRNIYFCGTKSTCPAEASTSSHLLFSPPCSFFPVSSCRSSTFLLIPDVAAAGRRKSAGPTVGTHDSYYRCSSIVGVPARPAQENPNGVESNAWNEGKLPCIPLNLVQIQVQWLTCTKWIVRYSLVRNLLWP